MSKSISKYRVSGVLLVATLALTACSGGSNKLPVLNDEAVSGDGYVSIARTQGNRLESVKTLVIAAFDVTYKLKAEGVAVTVSNEGDKEVKTSIKTQVNVADANMAMMQKMTNKAYNIFVDELKKANYEVVALDEVSKSDAYYQLNHKNLATRISPDDDEVTLVADGLKWFDDNEKMDPDGGILMGVANINSAVNGDLVAEFGGIEKGVAALNIKMTVQFGNFDLEDHRVSDAIAFNPSFTVIAGGTKMEVISDFRAVSMPGRVFYIPKESASYAMRQDMGSKTNVIAGMLEVGSGEGSKEYNATINEEGFERSGIEQIERVSQLMIKAMTGR